MSGNPLKIRQILILQSRVYIWRMEAVKTQPFLLEI